MCYSYGSPQFSLNCFLFLIETDTVCVIRCMQYVSDFICLSLCVIREQLLSRRFRQYEAKLMDKSTTSRLVKDVLTQEEFYFTKVDH